MDHARGSRHGSLGYSPDPKVLSGASLTSDAKRLHTLSTAARARIEGAEEARWAKVREKPGRKKHVMPLRPAAKRSNPNGASAKAAPAKKAFAVEKTRRPKAKIPVDVETYGRLLPQSPKQPKSICACSPRRSLETHAPALPLSPPRTITSSLPASGGHISVRTMRAFDQSTRCAPLLR